MQHQFIFSKMTQEQINEALIKEVKTAVNNVANAYEGLFQIKEDDEGSDRVSNCTLRLTSKDWKKGSQIKFSMDKYSEYLGEPNDPMYFACCEMGVLLDRLGFDGFAGAKYSYDMFGKKRPSVGKFVEELFLPTAIEILNFQKSKKSEVNNSKLKKFFNEMWAGTIKKVPTEEQIADLFDKTNESIDESEESETYEEYVKRFDAERQAAVDASKKFAELVIDKKFDEAEKYIHSNEFAKVISWFGNYRKQIEHFEDELFAAKRIASGKNPDGISWKK